jgi:putative ABC transport system ATP-binding protein
MQRVAIGRALINQPNIIMADEPTGTLDSATAHKILELFQSLNKQGLTLIIVTHNTELAKMARKTIHLRDGEIV